MVVMAGMVVLVGMVDEHRITWPFDPSGRVGRIVRLFFAARWLSKCPVVLNGRRGDADVVVAGRESVEHGGLVVGV